MRAKRVVAPSGRVGWTVVNANGVAVGPAEAFLRYRFDCEASPNTLRAYAHDLKLFFAFLTERSLAWPDVSPAELGEFVAWLRRPAGNVIPLPGMPPARAASTVNRASSAGPTPGLGGHRPGAADAFTSRLAGSQGARQASASLPSRAPLSAGRPRLPVRAGVGAKTAALARILVVTVTRSGRPR